MESLGFEHPNSKPVTNSSPVRDFAERSFCTANGVLRLAKVGNRAIARMPRGFGVEQFQSLFPAALAYFSPDSQGPPLRGESHPFPAEVGSIGIISGYLQCPIEIIHPLVVTAHLNAPSRGLCKTTKPVGIAILLVLRHLANNIGCVSGKIRPAQLANHSEQASSDFDTIMRGKSGSVQSNSPSSIMHALRLLPVSHIQRAISLTRLRYSPAGSSSLIALTHQAVVE